MIKKYNNNAIQEMKNINNAGQNYENRESWVLNLAVSKI